MAQIHALTPEGRLPSAAIEHVEEIVPHPVQDIDTATDWVQAEVDETGQLARAIDSQGRTWLRLHPDTPGIVDPDVAGQIQSMDVPGWRYAVVDETGTVASGVRDDGSVFPDPTGTATQPYDVVLVIGQSNAKGIGYPLANTDPVPGIDQYPALNKPEAGAITPAIEPLLHQGPVAANPGTGFPIPFARAYRAANPGRRVLLVPAAWGGTGFSTSAPEQGGTWDWTAPDDGTNLAINAVTQTVAALAAAGAGARLAGILWHQGEGDGSVANEYAGLLDGLIGFLRTELDAPTVPFIVGQMSPDRQGGGNAVIIDAAHQQTPARVERTAFAKTPPGLHNPGDATHLSTRALELIGPTFSEALARAPRNVTGAGPIGPENVTAHRSGDLIAVTWDPAWCRVTDYRIEWRAPAGTWATTGVNHTPALATTGTFTATGPVEVRVTTINEAGESTPVTTTA